MEGFRAFKDIFIILFQKRLFNVQQHQNLIPAKRQLHRICLLMKVVLTSWSDISLAVLGIFGAYLMHIQGIFYVLTYVRLIQEVFTPWLGKLNYTSVFLISGYLLTRTDSWPKLSPQTHSLGYLDLVSDRRVIFYQF